jgi:NAD(P)-dependent dehydrogenase (short-subunit alcohol dehydrogenase family)
MQKTILLTGATDGIGFETAKKLAALGHTLVLHGRNSKKLAQCKETLNQMFPNVQISTFLADLSNLNDVNQFTEQVRSAFSTLDVIINNAGVFKVNQTVTESGLDVRFVVNTLAPFVITKKLLPLMSSEGRVINLSSAAQAPVDLAAFNGQRDLSDSAAYAQSKLAITMWSAQLAEVLGDNGPSIIAVNPASFLGSKMVKEAYGSQGKDLSIGADILVKAALDEAFANASGQYFDNDIGQFTSPHPDALNKQKNQALVDTVNAVLASQGISI